MVFPSLSLYLHSFPIPRWRFCVFLDNRIRALFLIVSMSVSSRQRLTFDLLCLEVLGQTQSGKLPSVCLLL